MRSSPAIHWLAGLLFCAGTLQWLSFHGGSDDVRAWILSSCSIASLIVALLLAWEWRWFRVGLLVFAIMLVAGWVRAFGSHTADTHFAGASLGMLWMAMVGRHAVTPARLALASLLFLGLAVPALAVGMGGVPTFFPPDTYSAVTGDPSILRRALISAEGRAVNQNALAALVLLVAPVALSTLWLRERPRVLRFLMQAIGSVVFVGGVWILAVTRSDTALVAVWGVMLVVLVRGPKWWVWRVVAGAVTAALPLAALGWVYLVPRERALEAAAHIHRVLLDRVQILLFASRLWVDQLWLGIGLNEFRLVYAASGPRRSAAHAHNMFLQTGLDVGLIGLIAYCFILGFLLVRADHASRGPIAIARIVAVGSALSLIAVHLFGLADAVALGAKIGTLQWMAGGLILGAWRVQCTAEAPASVPLDPQEGAPAGACV